MDIKKRLIVCNTLTVIIPFIITSLVAFIFIFTFSKFFNTNINYANFRKSTFIKSELLNTVKDISKSNTKDIEDIQFKKYLNDKLSIINGKIIIIKNDDIIFHSEDISKLDSLEYTEYAKNKFSKNPVKINDTYYSIEPFSLQFKNNIQGKVIFLLPLAKETDIFKKFIIIILITFFICSILVNLIISYIFSKKISNPLAHLKKATTEIQRGDLNFKIVESGDREIRELCTNFEQMRIKLKDSVYMKMKYDDNRKMLVSSISHDLKTPLTSIEGYVQGILDGIANTPEKLDHYLKTINSKTKQIDGMIDDLLLYSKLDLKKLPFNFVKTDILYYFTCCIEESEPELAKSNIKISLQNQLKISKYVMLDKERFMRVILNIIGNSKKYMDKNHGEIIIVLRETTSSIIIEIKDNGSGINKDDINKIFSRFYRGDSARSSAKGNGLGLAIAKQIVEGHDGKIWAAAHENKGTSIIIKLPQWKFYIKEL